uniref:Methylmalonic aciduria type A-like protein, mitochondrial n=1 Tax=Auxenochlorella protothecoides TaxID=3075 RepID=A0A1D2A9X7_AUXPR
MHRHAAPVLRSLGKAMSTYSSAAAAAARLRNLFDAKDVAELVDGIRHGQRLAVSRAITLVESTRPQHKQSAAALLSQLSFRPGSAPPPLGLRVGISGPPGAGKSSLIEALGCALVNAGEKVAVLAIDPSSAQTGGAILGDKTRMSKLSCLDGAFVRPTPSRGTLGGVARATADAVAVCEAAGFTWTLIETVGVGQSEVAVSRLCDCMALVMPPVGGDELQVIKRGITELADLVVVNKADGPTQLAARRAAAAFRGTLHFHRAVRRAWTARVQTASALTGEGVGALVDNLREYRQALLASGELQQLRRDQAIHLAWKAAEEGLLEDLRSSEGVQAALGTLRPQLAAGSLGVRPAAEAMLAALRAEWSSGQGLVEGIRR